MPDSFPDTSASDSPAPESPAPNSPAHDNSSGGVTAVAEPKTASKSATKNKPKPKPPGLLPQWKVLLHNDDVNEVTHVVASLVEITPLKLEKAVLCTVEAHETGVSLLLITHKERAELYQEQLQSKGLTVTIEPVEEG